MIINVDGSHTDDIMYVNIVINPDCYAPTYIKRIIMNHISSAPRRKDKYTTAICNGKKLLSCLY